VRGNLARRGEALEEQSSEESRAAGGEAIGGGAAGAREASDACPL
jgi:hypothetical protein